MWRQIWRLTAFLFLAVTAIYFIVFDILRAHPDSWQQTWGSETIYIYAPHRMVKAPIRNLECVHDNLTWIGRIYGPLLNRLAPCSIIVEAPPSPPPPPYQEVFRYPGHSASKCPPWVRVEAKILVIAAVARRLAVTDGGDWYGRSGSIQADPMCVQELMSLVRELVSRSELHSEWLDEYLVGRWRPPEPSRP